MLTARRPRARKPAALTVQQATTDAARLARKHLALPTGTRVHIDSKHVAGGDLVVRMGTTIRFPEMSRERSKALADAVQALPGYHSIAWNAVSISFLRAI
jgi:hypothetical protein